MWCGIGAGVIALIYAVILAVTVSKKDAGNGVTMALAIKMPKLRFEGSV